MLPTSRRVPSLFPCLVLAWAGPVAATASAAPPGDTPYIWELLAILLPLAFIIVCLLVLLRVLRKRFGLTGPETPLSVVQVLPVGPRERIVVLRSRAGRAFAVGVSAGAVTLISSLDTEDLGPTADDSLPPQSAPPSLLQRYRVKRS